MSPSNLTTEQSQSLTIKVLVRFEYVAALMQRSKPLILVDKQATRSALGHTDRDRSTDSSFSLMTRPYLEERALVKGTPILGYMKRSIAWSIGTEDICEPLVYFLDPSRCFYVRRKNRVAGSVIELVQPHSLQPHLCIVSDAPVSATLLM